MFIKFTLGCILLSLVVFIIYTFLKWLNKCSDKKFKKPEEELEDSNE